jgi:hypothetical protein
MKQIEGCMIQIRIFSRVRQQDRKFLRTQVENVTKSVGSHAPLGGYPTGWEPTKLYGVATLRTEETKNLYRSCGIEGRCGRPAHSFCLCYIAIFWAGCEVLFKGDCEHYGLLRCGAVWSGEVFPEFRRNHAPSALPHSRLRAHGARWIRGWVNIRAAVDDVKKRNISASATVV